MKLFRSTSDDLDNAIKKIDELSHKIDEKDELIYEHKCQIDLLEDEKENLLNELNGWKIEKERLVNKIASNE